MYDYDRRHARTAATFQPEAAFRIEGGDAIVSFLIGGWIAAYRRPVKDTPEEVLEAELLMIKTRLESLSGPDEEAAWDKADNLLVKEGFRPSPDLNDRDRGLSLKQHKYKQEAKVILSKRLGKWLREHVVKFVEETYAAFRRGNFQKEPCITASYFRDAITQGGFGYDDGFAEFKRLFLDFSTSKQLAACGYALEAASKSGKLRFSGGLGSGGRRRETKCYELAQ